MADWLQSGKAFHVMRDWWTHTEVMLAGMWGGTGGVLPPLQTLLEDFKPASLANWHLDQWFLRAQVWPTARQSCLIHDSKFRALGSQDFPARQRAAGGTPCGPERVSVRKPKSFKVKVPLSGRASPAPGGKKR